MNMIEFDLDSLMNLQLMYNPLKKVLEYLLVRDKALGDSLSKVEIKLDSHENKFTELQKNIIETKSSVSMLQDITKKHEDQIVECSISFSYYSNEVED